jgi:four helix bundle protein
MVFRRLEDLAVWQLSTRLEHKVYEFLDRFNAKWDVDFCRDLRRSAASAPRNIEEGFGRFWPTEFSPKLRIARGELHETRGHLLKAIRQQYLTEEDAIEMLLLAKRAIGAATGLLAYFDRHGPTWKKEFLARLRAEGSEPEPEPELEPEPEPELEPPEPDQEP